jgi:putative endonuclease
MSQGRRDRVRAYSRSRLAETLCRWILRFKGYVILESGYRTKVGEIDVVATRGGQGSRDPRGRAGSRDLAAATAHRKSSGVVSAVKSQSGRGGHPVRCLHGGAVAASVPY